MLLLVWVLSFLFDVHAPNRTVCIVYTALLLLQLPWPEPSWFYALWFAVNWPTFGPKGRPKASAQDKEVQLRQELADFLAANDGVRPAGRTPRYQKIRRAGLLHLLETPVAQSQEDKEIRLRKELEVFLENNGGTRPQWNSALYVRLQKANLLHLLEAPVAQSQEDKEIRLRKELEVFLENNGGTRPPRNSALYVRLQKANLLHLLEAPVAQSQEDKEMCLHKELEDFLENNGGSRPPRTSALYVRLQKADLLHLLDAPVAESQEDKEMRLRKELEDFLENNGGSRPPRTSALYVRLQKANLLHLLDAPVAESQEDKEMRLRKELEVFLENNGGTRPPWNSALYVRLQKARMLHWLPSANVSAGIVGHSPVLLDSELCGGVLEFVAGKSVQDCLPFTVDMEEESLQRYSKDVAQSRRCFFADILVAVTRGLEPSSKFGMETLTAEAQDAACSWLDSLSFVGYDDTKTLRNTLLRFCQEEQRWPEKDGGHALDRDLLTSLGKLRSRRFGSVTNKRQGNIHEYALPLREDQMLAWETLPYQSCFVWWPHNLEVFEQVRMLWDEQGILPTRGPQSATDALAQKVRRVRAKTLLPGRKAMRAAEQACWGSTFPKIWQRRVDKEAYIQAADFQDFECRWPFARSPQALQMMACELCGVECNTHLEFIKHLEQTHVLADDEGSRASWWTKHRVVEEYRKRMVFYEQTEGSLLCVSHVMSLQVQLLGNVFFDHLHFRTPLYI